VKRPWYIDAIIAAALLAVGTIVGIAHVRAFVRAGGQPVFYQSYFEPAVMWTCGRGFVRTIDGPGQAIAAFLRTERNDMDCDEIPRDAAITTDGLYQRAWLYLMLSVGTVWWVTGISWSGLAPLFGVLYGATIAAAYGIFRLAAGRVIAMLLALALTVSTLHLQNLPHLRDYAKAPFVLVLILLMGLIVTQQSSRRSLMIVAALYGLVLGIGYGFRSDLLASIPPLLLAVAFLPGGWRANLVLKAAMVAVALAVFACASHAPGHANGELSRTRDASRVLVAVHGGTWR
jgi:hypothetical protein